MEDAQACGRTRGALDGLLTGAQYGENAPAYNAYFFKNKDGTKMHPTRDDLDDDIDRCKKCGCTIYEHQPKRSAAADAKHTGGNGSVNLSLVKEKFRNYGVMKKKLPPATTIALVYLSNRPLADRTQLTDAALQSMLDNEPWAGGGLSAFVVHRGCIAAAVSDLFTPKLLHVNIAVIAEMYIDCV